MSDKITQDGDKHFGLDCSPITIDHAGQTYTYLLDNITFTNPSTEVTDTDDKGVMDDQVIIAQPKEGSAVLQIKKGTPVPLPGQTFQLNGTRNDGVYIIRTSDEPQVDAGHLKSNITFRQELNPATLADPTIHFVSGDGKDITFANADDYETALNNGSLGVYATDYRGGVVPVDVYLLDGKTLESWEDPSQAWVQRIRYTARDAQGRTTVSTRAITIQAQS